MAKLPIFSRRTKGGAYWYCYVRTPDSRRLQRALHIRDDGTRDSERAATSAYWREQARATNGELDREVRVRKTLGKALKALALEQELAGLKEETKHVSLWAAAKLLEHWGPEYDVTTLTAEDLVKYATQARSSRVADSVRIELGTLNRAMRAIDVVCPRRPKLGGQSSKPQQPLTEAEVRRMLMAANPTHKLVLLVLVLLGLRRGEYSRLGEVDWARQLIYIAGTKTKRSKRWVPVPQELFEHMQSLRAADGGWPGFPKYSYKSIYAIVTTVAERAGLGHRHPNDLRGTHATLLALRGVSASERAALQGNSEAIQERTYSQPHTAPEALREAVSKMPRMRASGASDVQRQRRDRAAVAAASGVSDLPKTQEKPLETD
jgi:integrase